MNSFGISLMLLGLLSIFHVTVAQSQTNSNSNNYRLVYGILDQPSLNESTCNLTPFGDKYIAASYVKFIEATGAQVVPVPYDAPFDDLRDILLQLDGILFPGGDADFSEGTQFYNASQYIFNTINEWNLDYMKNPQSKYQKLRSVVGVCQGFEVLSVLMAGGNFSVLVMDGYNASNYSVPLVFTPAAPYSRMWGVLPGDSIFAFVNFNITFNAHSNGVPPARWQDNPQLQAATTLLSTNQDRNGREFASSWESRTGPIWAVQFHPERDIFEWWSQETMKHSLAAVQPTKQLGLSLYRQGLQNLRQMWEMKHKNVSQGPVTADGDWLQANVIYNSRLVYTYPVCPMFEQSYFFSAYSKKV